MDFIERVESPEDLKALTPEETVAYCDALREFLIDSVSRTGGHLGSNLGVVELTVALHRVYDFRRDRLVLDVSHQVYPHKVITGRRHRFPTLRQTDGLSGFMHRGESPYDTFTSGHAGMAVSVAAGMALADHMRGIRDRRAVALVGDAAVGAGATFEALNHAGQGEAPLLVILNDNQWSIARTVGAMRKYLNRVRTLPAYREGKKELLESLDLLPLIGESLSRWVGSMKDAVANYLSPGQFFRELGWTYFGPESGHDVLRLETLLRDLQRVEGPVLLHVVTEKGRGYETPGDDAAHAVSPRQVPRPATAAALPPQISWSNAFGRTVADLMEGDPRIVAVTAAMPGGTGLLPVASRFPERVVDVGICEQHGVGLAAGMAESGLKPIAAIYSTFLQRGYDQVFQEVALQQLPVVLAMDRAGIVGGDGVTHQGVYDIAFLRTIPGIVLMAPADPPELDAMLRYAVAQPTPTAVRFPRGSVPDRPLPGNDRRLRHGRGVRVREGSDLVLFAYGSMVRTALEAAEILAGKGIEATVFNARFARPLDTQAIDRFVEGFDLMLTLEEHAASGGFGSAVLEHLATRDPTARGVGARGAGARNVAACVVRVLGVPDRFIPHGEARDWLARLHLDAQGIAVRAEREWKALRERDATPSSVEDPES